MIRGLSELVLIVADVSRSAAFYSDIVGLKLERPATDQWAWFTVGPTSGRQRLALHRGPLLFEEHSPRPPGERFGRVHFAMEVPRQDLDSQVERVRSAGVAVYGPVRLEWMLADSWYFYDPDGNLVEFWSPDQP
ncbi:MAG: VOC family protein [Phycisphaeraceae bacterium]|nr:VOC family protein [Phycisphaerae bacterium]MBX3393315.1 VOC family protein [Phycisphaeraceae bacterium]HRJ50634.1 VOC family protein [Phycisphaerales bacterium]